MTKEQIQESYKIAEDLWTKNNGAIIKDFVSIGIQMALNGEIVYNENGSIQRIE